MDLSEYLKQHGLTHAEFAKKVGVTRPMVTFLVNKSKRPSEGLIRRIVSATEGEVSREALLLGWAPKGGLWEATEREKGRPTLVER